VACAAIVFEGKNTFGLKNDKDEEDEEFS